VFSQLVLALPLPEAVRCFENVPTHITEAVSNLRYNALRVAFIAVNNESLMDKSAVYLPDPSVLPHRVCFMGFFSPNMVRPGTSSLVAEVTTRPNDEVDRLTDRALTNRIVADLHRIGIINKQDVILTDTKRVEYGYPVYNKSYSCGVAMLREYLGDLGIHQVGRFAEFDYINSDECIRRAIVLAEQLNAGVS
jgi:protoporphyrinogen oxidase